MLDFDFFDLAWESYDPKTSVSYIPYDTVTDAMVDADIVEGIDALITQERREEIQLGDGVAIFTVSKDWFLRVAHLGDTKVTKRGIIVDSEGLRWGVNWADKRTIGTRWACNTTLLTDT